MLYKCREVLLFITVFLLSFRAPIGPDFWWHLRYGEEMLKNFKIPYSNEFSYTLTDYKWANSYWASDIVIAFLKNAGGFFVVPLTFSIVFSLFLILLGRKFFPVFYARSLALVTFSFMVSSAVVVARPLFFSTIFMILLWFVLISRDLRERYFLFLPALFLVWANMHADFIVGLGIVFAAVFFEIIEGGIRGAKKALTALLCLVSTFVNPYGPLLHLTIFREIINMKRVNNHIVEFMPSDAWSLGFFLLVFCLSVICFAFLGGFFRKGSPLQYRNFTITTIVVTAIFSIASSYFLRFLLIFSIPLFHYFFLHFSVFKSQVRTLLGSVHGKLLVLILALSVVQAFLTNFALSLDVKLLSSERGYPYGAVQFLKSKEGLGNVLNRFNWGGYLIYFLPEYKTFIDGRMTSWLNGRESFLQEYIDIERADAGWLRKVVERSDISWAIFPPEHRISVLLREDLGWEVLYEDDIATVLKKPEGLK